MKKIFKRGMSGLLAVLMALTVLAGFGATSLRRKRNSGVLYDFFPP